MRKLTKGRKKLKQAKLKTGSDEWYAHYDSYAKRQSVEWSLYAEMSKITINPL